MEQLEIPIWLKRYCQASEYPNAMTDSVREEDKKWCPVCKEFHPLSFYEINAPPRQSNEDTYQKIQKYYNKKGRYYGEM